jgi:mono/diheme cytochrome c family protein
MTMRVALLLTVLVVASGCSKKSQPSDNPQAEAQQIFSDRCATCHGEKGRGDGITAASFKPRPRDFADPEWQKRISDDQMKTVIVKGGTAVGKSPNMIPNTDLESKPDVVAGLVGIVRGFAKK